MNFYEAMKQGALALSLIGMLALTKTTAQGQDAPAGSADNGRAVYRSAGCQRCHGQNGQGADAPALAPDPIPYADFVRTVRSGKGEMLAIEAATLKDSDLTDIYAFLKTVK
jgi:mono/diheme cytochrome c family protein